jgi:PIN domain nuclease of toxin-antitoxin system
MKLLLDTHIWLWTTLEPRKVGRVVRRELARPNNELYLSPVSIWEAHQAHIRKRLRIQQEFHTWLAENLHRSGLQEAPLTFAVAVETCRISLPQPDLGDLFLAATASVYGLTLATADPQLLECRWLKTLSNEG